MITYRIVPMANSLSQMKANLPSIDLQSALLV